MKMYILFKRECDDNYKTVCVSEKIDKISASLQEYFNLDMDFPKLEIWENRDFINCVGKDEVLKEIEKEKLMKITYCPICNCRLNTERNF